MHRAGFTQVPNHVWDDVRLDGVDISLLTYLASHAPGFIIKGPIARQRIGISEPTYNTRMRKLVGLGLVSKEKAYLEGRVAGIYVQTSWPKLSEENVGSVQHEPKATEPTKATHSIGGSLRRTNFKNSAPPPKYDKYGQVIDYLDDGSTHEF